jgi:hypothetical protein
MPPEHCPHMAGCEMYGLFQLTVALRVWQVNYCESEYQTCARYQKACSAEAVPINLLPNGKFLHKEPQR